MLQATPFGHPHGAAELPNVSQQVHGLHDAFGKTSGGVYHGWGVPKSWGVPQASHLDGLFHGDSDENGWSGGTPISGSHLEIE